MTLLRQLLPLIFSANFLSTVIRVATPLILCAMAACIGKQANVQTITYEGMMLFAALAGTLGTSYTNSLIGGIIIGVLASVLLAGIYGYFNIYLDTYDTLLGIAMNNFSNYFTIFLLFVLIGRKADSSTIVSYNYPIINIPIIKDIPIIGTILSGQSLVTYFAIISVFVAHFIVYKSTLGLRVRSVGRSPEAASSLGIDVRKTKMIAMLISGVFAGLAGEFMSMSYISFFTKNMVAGRGFIGIAASNLALGRPFYGLLYALMFAVSQVIANQLQMLQFTYQFANMIPYIITIIGLCITGSAEIRKEKMGGKTKEDKKKDEKRKADAE
ncbi:MAG: ABC transporter permease [Erysipelotrichaceae bacterium]|nr:ABC transporter permease [Erysipelotrichaceae bacterium]MBR6724687.1 ABC transporter permease [Erysipelotrichaceae bacterium]